MKTILVTNYSFNKAAQTVTFSDFTTIEPSRILSIIDVTNGQSIYNYRLPGYVGTVAGNVLTLQFNTNNNQFNNSDKLYIEYAADTLSLTLVPSAARTASYTGDSITNPGYRGATLAVNVSAISGESAAVVVKLQMLDVTSSTWIDVPGAATASIIATGQTLLSVYPGLTPSANTKVDYPLPNTYRVVSTITGTTPSITFSVSVTYNQ